MLRLMLTFAEQKQPIIFLVKGAIYAIYEPALIGKVPSAALRGSGTSYSKTDTCKLRGLQVPHAAGLQVNTILEECGRHVRSMCPLACCFWVSTWIHWATLLSFSKKRGRVVSNKHYMTTCLGDCHVQRAPSGHQDLHRHLISVCFCSMFH